MAVLPVRPVRLRVPASLRRVARPALIVAATVALSTWSRPLAAQTLMNAETATDVRKVFLDDLDSLQSRFLSLASAIPADKYTWRPGAGVRSVGEVFMHVASEYYTFGPAAYGLPRSPVIPRSATAFADFEKNSTPADVKKHLTEGFDFMRKAVANADINALTGKRKIFGGDRTIAETSVMVTDDLHEHLGQLIAYARMNGIKPPWTK